MKSGDTVVSVFLPKLTWRDGIVIFLKDTTKIITARKAYALGDLRDRKIGFGQESLGAADAIAVEILDGGHLHILVKFAVHIVDR